MTARERSRSYATDACARARRLRCACICSALLAATLLWSGCERVDHGVAIAVRPLVPAARPDRRPAPRLVAPAIRTIELGRSVRDVPLTLEIFGEGPDRVLIFGGIHGSEPTSAAVAGKMADHLRINWELFAGKTVAILAQANPDGLARRSRANANGVDLNRNFPARNWRRPRRGAGFGGCAPASEPETRAIMRAIELIRPTRIISIHSTRWGRQCNNFDGPAEDLAQLMARFNGYPVKATMGYPTPGSFGSWAGVDRQIPTITLELPNHLSSQRCWRDNVDALRVFLEADRGAPVVGR